MTKPVSIVTKKNSSLSYKYVAKKELHRPPVNLFLILFMSKQRSAYIIAVQEPNKKENDRPKKENEDAASNTGRTDIN